MADISKINNYGIKDKTARDNHDAMVKEINEAIEAINEALAELEYTLPVATSTALGGIKIGYTAIGANLPVALSSEKAYVAVTKTAVTTALGYTPPESNTDTKVTQTKTTSASSMPLLLAPAGQTATTTTTANFTNNIYAVPSTGRLYVTGSSNPLFGLQATNGTAFFLQAQTDKLFLGPTSAKALTFTGSTGAISMPNNLTVTGTISEGGTTLANKYLGKTAKAASATVADSANAVAWSKVSGKPTFATVATSGSYNDLTNKPTIPSAYTLPLAASGTRGGVQIGYSESGANLALKLSSEKGYVTLSKTSVTTALGYTPPETDTTYSVATASKAGLVKPVSVITKPTLNSVTTTSGKYYQVQMSSDGNMFVNVPWQAGTSVDLSGYTQNKDNPNLTYYATDNGTTTAGTWLGKNDNVTALFDGLSVNYKVTKAGASTTTFNLNGLGAKTVYLRGTTKLTTHYEVGTIVNMIYNSTTGAWYVADYDANSYAYLRQYYTLTNTDGEYPIIYSYTKDTGTSSYKTAYGAVKGGFTFNPSTDTLSVGGLKFIGDTANIQADGFIALSSSNDVGDVAEVAVNGTKGTVNINADTAINLNSNVYINGTPIGNMDMTGFQGLDLWYNAVSDTSVNDDGICWTDQFGFMDSAEEYTHTGLLYNKVPIVAGDNVTFTVDETNQVVKINATGGGSSSGGGIRQYNGTVGIRGNGVDAFYLCDDYQNGTDFVGEVELWITNGDMSDVSYINLCRSDGAPLATVTQMDDEDFIYIKISFLDDYIMVHGQSASGMCYTNGANYPIEKTVRDRGYFITIGNTSSGDVSIYSRGVEYT